MRRLGLMIVALAACRGRGCGAEAPRARGGDDDVRAALEALGYVAEGDAAPKVSGVLTHDRARVADGTNLVVSSDAYEVRLLDMAGAVVHTWALGAADRPTKPPRAASFRKARLLPDGDVLALIEGSWLYRLRKDSTVRWRSELHHHHDLDVAPDGTIHALTRKAIPAPRLGGLAVLEDRVSVLDPETGAELRTTNLLRAFAETYRDVLMSRGSAGVRDLLHVNALDILPPSAPAEHPGFVAGGYLVSSRGLNVVAVVDPNGGAITWKQQGPFSAQHDPSLVADAGLLLFDNHPPGPSAAVEVDLRTGEERWRWAGDGYYSACCGTTQRLANGHTLVVVTDAGQAHEVTPAGEVVWSWTSPYRVGRGGERVARLMDLVRLPPVGELGWVGATP